MYDNINAEDRMLFHIYFKFSLCLFQVFSDFY